MSSTPSRLDADRAGTVRRGLAIIGMGIREQPGSFAVAVAGSALYGAMTVASAWVFGEVTDRVILPSLVAGEVSRGVLATAAVAIVAVGVLKSAGIVTRRIGATHMQLRLQSEYRQRVSRQYTSLPLSWHRRHSTGELLSNANADVEATFGPVAPLPFAVGVAFLLVLSVGVLVVTDPYVAAVGFLIAPLMGAVNWRYNRVIRAPATRAQQLRAEVSDVAHESFEGALVVKTLGREAAETERFRAESERLRDQLIAFGRLRAMFDPVIEALPSVGVLLILLVGGWRVTTGDLAPGEIVRVAVLFTLLAFPIRVIGFLLGDLPRSVVGWDRVRRVLEARNDLPSGTDDAAPRGTAADVDLVDVGFRYGEEPTLREVTFRARPGRTIALVGPTGAGKSTIASLLVRLADPGEGAVRLDGRDLRDLADGAVSREAAIVFQHTFLFDDTVRNNITLGAPYTDGEVRAAAVLAQADEFVTALPDGYETVLGERGATLSGGQRQRVALARALVRRPRLLILDDATSSVDPTVERMILEGLREADLPSTVVVVAYRRATIALADEVVYVERGAVRAHGSHAHLLETVPAYEQLITAYDPPPDPAP